MYTPRHYKQENKQNIVKFMQMFPFGTLVSSENEIPVATHLPFVTAYNKENNDVVIYSHFAKANPQWKTLEGKKVLIIFNEPHAYISPKNYNKNNSVPTWNYVSVHVYGSVSLVNDKDEGFKILEKAINSFEKEYYKQWEGLSTDYKNKMFKGIQIFKFTPTEFQATEKLSQNKTKEEQKRIAKDLLESDLSSDKSLGDFMNENISNYK